MVRNDFEIDVKVKCLEERVTQAKLTEMVGTSAPYISRLINKQDGIVNKTFVDMLDKLGYDIQITYVKKDSPKIIRDSSFMFTCVSFSSIKDETSRFLHDKAVVFQTESV